MRTIVTALLLLFSGLNFASGGVEKSPKPLWVNKIYPSDKTTLDNQGSYQYLLIDNQADLAKEAFYSHYAVKVLNADGVQAMSDLSVSFDPTYQKLFFHEIIIHRGDKVINKLVESDIQLFQREQGMERSLYDGSLSAVVNLKDVRENDIIEYAYTITGINPINKGHYSAMMYHQFTIPVNRVYTRVVNNSKKNLQYKLYDGAAEPAVVSNHGFKEYIWDVNAIDFKLYDNNVPAWFETHKRVAISTFSSWKEVVDWALPLYKHTIKGLPDLESTLNESSKILEIIRLVQDEIRYLGFESGIGAYKPNDPDKVLAQRYGDCKDKSLLLVSMLKKEGVEAYPLLVNTRLKDEITEALPSNSIFDHCVVMFKHDGKSYFVDPTISSQGGSLDKMYFPNYRRGLLIKANNSTLMDIPASKASTLDIKELITVDSIGGGAELIIRSEYTGSKADYIRGSFNSNSKESIEKEYLNFYSSLYPGIEQAEGVKFYDYDRKTTNKIIVEESYTIKKFWFKSEDSTTLYCETYPIVLESLISLPKTSKRGMPYYLGEPFIFTQNTQVILPEQWSVEYTESNMEGDGFRYKNVVKGNGNTVSITHQYELNKEYVGGKGVDAILKKHEEIKNGMSYYLTYNHSLTGFKISWVALVITLLAVVSSILLLYKVYYNYDPKPLTQAKDLPIGGWLILPAIGLVLSPILLIRTIIVAGFFNHNTWSQLSTLEFEQMVNAYFVYGFELLYNVFFIAFTILILISFFKRRSNVPRLITIYYTLSFLVPLIDLLIVDQLLQSWISASETTNAYGSITRSVIVAAIWIPYFNISERVKNTFCVSLKKAEEEDDFIVPQQTGSSTA